jgi:cytochrome c-type biogenesis protein CcmH/NrfG
MFALLAVIFALSFAFLGVGSGSSGLSDFLNGNINLFGGGSEDVVKSLQKKVQKNPQNAALRLQLAQAFDGKGRIDESVAAYEAYRKLRPQNVDGLSQIAGEYGKQAQQFQAQAQNVSQTTAPPMSVLNAYTPAPPTSPLGKALAKLAVPAFSASSLQQGQALVLQQKARQSYARRAAAFRKLAEIQPDETSWLFQVADTERQAGNTDKAIAAYQAFIKKFPDDQADIALAQGYIKQLKAGPSSTAGTTSPTTPTG